MWKKAKKGDIHLTLLLTRLKLGVTQLYHGHLKMDFVAENMYWTWQGRVYILRYASIGLRTLDTIYPIIQLASLRSVFTIM